MPVYEPTTAARIRRARRFAKRVAKSEVEAAAASGEIVRRRERIPSGVLEGDWRGEQAPPMGEVRDAGVERPMRRAITRLVEAPLSELLVSRRVRPGDVVLLDVEAGAVVVDAVSGRRLRRASWPTRASVTAY